MAKGVAANWFIYSSQVRSIINRLLKTIFMDVMARRFNHSWISGQALIFYSLNNFERQLEDFFPQPLFLMGTQLKKIR